MLSYRKVLQSIRHLRTAYTIFSPKLFEKEKLYKKSYIKETSFCNFYDSNKELPN